MPVQSRGGTQAGRWHSRPTRGGEHVVTMEGMGIRALRDSLTQTIRRVRSGEAVEITHDGKPVAALSPHQPTRLEQLIAEGKLRPSLRAPKRPLPPPLKQTGRITASEALADDRGD